MLHGATGFRFTATDLSPFIECEHLAWLEGQAALGRRTCGGAERDPMANILAERGRQHERAYLAQLERDGIAVTHVAYRADAPGAAIEATREAMRRGDPVLYQAVLEDGRWFGIADFLERVERPSSLGAWSYEAADAKLARRTKAHYLLQLSLYSELVHAVQGAFPERMHVLLGDEPGPDGRPTVRRDSYHCRDFAAYFHALRRRFEGVVESPAEPCYPLPVEFCNLCRWSVDCASRRERDDHPCRVYGMKRVQIPRLQAAGVGTMHALAALPEGASVRRVAPDTLDRLRAQARLQIEQQRDGEPRYELLVPTDRRGFDLLPPPSPGDVFFDMEGDPYFEGRGLEYLFGADFADGPDGRSTYRAWWAHDKRGQEQRAFEQFVDFVVARRLVHPDLHVYHYAPYEPSRLKRLAGFYATREAELDDLLRNQVLVDLYAVVRQAMRVSTESQSIKQIEHFYMGARKAAVKAADDSIVQYELYLATGDATKLTSIEDYNREDCESTRLLRDWLLARKAEAWARYGPPAPAPAAADRAEKPGAEDKRQERARIEAERLDLIARLTEGLDGDPDALRGVERGRWLVAQLLDYHQREERPRWWMYYARLEMTLEELIDDTECIGGLEPDPECPPYKLDRSLAHSFRFPVQDTKLGPGAAVEDPATRSNAGTLVAIDPLHGRLVLKRGPTLAAAPLPRVLVPGIPYSTAVQRAALRRFAASALATGLAGPGRYRALRDLVLGVRPRARGHVDGSPLQSGHVDLDSAWPLVAGLDASAVFVQGPPGAGKTTLGAGLIVALMKAGNSVGVTGQSHRAIHNLLHKVEAAAREQGVTFRGLKKSSSEKTGDNDSVYASELPAPFITNVTKNPEGLPDGVQLLAGTAWLFSDQALDAALDYLFVDEAGQISLADAIAMGTSARNLVLLGDPQQLAQVSQAVHPRGAGASVLQHLLGEDDTIPPDRGLFLDQSWRMHPEVCAFISELAYEARLTSAPGLEVQLVESSAGLSGAGLRYLPVEHTGNSHRSDEEVARIERELGLLLADGAFTDRHGRRRRLTGDDILIVAPYNAQVQALLERMPQAQVGTVDKFQGREAAVVFFSMATSSGEDLPRDLEFLYSRNRLNVAISRARALSVLVASPRLLQVSCKDAAEMRMVNGVCRFVELASLDGGARRDGPAAEAAC